ncbi:MAG: hypothetical protein EA408_10215 [Marinilabiliales bacterium]|nr:MAG: hypothetical protein EA408_10215 [Marinilabiliales bacterium]
MKMKSLRSFVFPLLILGMMIMATLSCDKDDDFKLEGTWNIDKVEMYMGTQLIEEFTTVNAGTITFNANGTGSATDNQGTDSFNWTLSGSNLTIIEEDVTIVMTLTTMEKDLMVAEFTETFDEMTFNVVMTLSKK